ncbi:hypothetical protein ASZ90_009153 [hydrocarbon metagenome]|uniref:Uncharacterized protein n=1 Tax=hydrocarbon metagenome TaxID=938273 RepID=A0A0W8FJP3_9ZZZZ
MEKDMAGRGGPSDTDALRRHLKNERIIPPDHPGKLFFGMAERFDGGSVSSRTAAGRLWNRSRRSPTMRRSISLPQ